MTEKPSGPLDLSDTSHPFYDSARDPTHPFYEGSKTESEPKPNASDKDEYKVGPGYPPNEHKWKKGCPSPYPKGRPKKIPSLKPEIAKLFEGALNEKVHVTKADKKIMMTRLAMGFEQLAIQWAKGDRHARRDVIAYAAILGIDLQPKEVLAEALGIDNQAIVDAYVQRLQSVGTAPDDHVKAPTDLVDDDATKSEPIEKQTTAAQTPIQKPLAPEIDEYGRPKLRDRAFIQAERERNLAEQKKNQGES